MTEVIQGLGRGNLYSGKTREQCMQEQSFWQKLVKGDELKIFDKADKDGDGILSAEEICEQRDNYYKKHIVVGLGSLMTIGLALCAVPRISCLESFMFKHANKIGLAIMGVLGLAGYDAVKIENQNKITKEYREKYLETPPADSSKEEVSLEIVA